MGRSISLRQLNRATLQRQGLIERHSGTTGEVIGHLAGLQAQHANSPYVALWSRREDQTIADLESALTEKEVVKASLMRTTLHLVAAADYAVYDAATAPSRIENWTPTARRADLDLGELNEVLRQFCSEPRSVAEIADHLDDRYPQGFTGDHLPAGVRNVGFRMASAAGGVVHVPPSGLWKSHDKPRYLTADEWLGPQPEWEADEALDIVIQRYLAAYGPVTRRDIVKWAGQRKVTPVKQSLTRLDDALTVMEGPDGSEFIDLADRPRPDADLAVPVRFLSRWDSALIGYDARDRILPEEYRSAVIKKNGDFLPTFLVDGFVAGLWSTDAGAGKAVLRLEPFADIPAPVRAELEEEGEALVRYVEPDSDELAIEWA